MEELKPQPEVMDTPPSYCEFDLQGFATDSLLSHEVCAPETLFLGVTIANNEDIIHKELESVVGVYRTVEGKSQVWKVVEEVEESVANNNLVVKYEHMVFDEMPIREVVSPCDKLVSFSENLVETGLLETTRMADAKPNSKVVGIPDVSSVEKEFGRSWNL